MRYRMNLISTLCHQRPTRLCRVGYHWQGVDIIHYCNPINAVHNVQLLVQATLRNSDWCGPWISGLYMTWADDRRCRMQQACTAKLVNFQKYRHNPGPSTTPYFTRPSPHFPPSIYLSFFHLELSEANFYWRLELGEMAWECITLVEGARLIHEIAGPDCSTLLNLKW